MPKGKFELYKDNTGKFRFRLRAPNGEIVASSEAYQARDSCVKGLKSVKRIAAKADVVDLTKT